MKKEIKLHLVGGDIYDMPTAYCDGLLPVLCLDGLQEHVELPSPPPRNVVLVLTTDKPKGNKYHILKGDARITFYYIKIRRPEQRKWTELVNYMMLSHLIQGVSGNTDKNVYGWIEYNS